MTKPLTPAMLADRWSVTEKTIKRYILKGAIPHFRLGGKLPRIPLEAVESLERQWTIGSEGTEANAPSSSTETGSATDTRSEPLTRLRLAAVRRPSTTS